MEVQKLYDLKQLTTIAAVAAWKGREGAQLEVERVGEKRRVASDEEASKTVINDDKSPV